MKTENIIGKEGEKMPIRGKIICFFILILLLCNSHLLFADEKSHYEAASQFIELIFDKNTITELFMAGASLGAKAHIESNPKMKPYSEIILDTMMSVMWEFINDNETQNYFKREFAKLYMEYFTEHELRDISKYYQTDVGQKALRLMPEMTRKGMKIGGELKLTPKYEQMLVEKFKDLIKKGILPKELEK
jgi:hypothetical protein